MNIRLFFSFFFSEVYNSFLWDTHGPQRAHSKNKCQASSHFWNQGWKVPEQSKNEGKQRPERHEHWRRKTKWKMFLTCIHRWSWHWCSQIPPPPWLAAGTPALSHRAWCSPACSWTCCTAGWHSQNVTCGPWHWPDARKQDKNNKQLFGKISVFVFEGYKRESLGSSGLIYRARKQGKVRKEGRSNKNRGLRNKWKHLDSEGLLMHLTQAVVFLWQDV